MSRTYRFSKEKRNFKMPKRLRNYVTKHQAPAEEMSAFAQAGLDPEKLGNKFFDRRKVGHALKQLRRQQQI